MTDIQVIRIAKISSYFQSFKDVMCGMGANIKLPKLTEAFPHQQKSILEAAASHYPQYEELLFHYDYKSLDEVATYFQIETIHAYLDHHYGQCGRQSSIFGIFEV
jgi:hypothetical protein